MRRIRFSACSRLSAVTQVVVAGRAAAGGPQQAHPLGEGRRRRRAIAMPTIRVMSYLVQLRIAGAGAGNSNLAVHRRCHVAGQPEPACGEEAGDLAAHRLFFGVAAMVGAFAGGRAGAYVPAPVLMLSFTAVMTAAAIAMIRGRRQTGDQHERPPELPISKVLATGAVVGLVSGVRRRGRGLPHRSRAGALGTASDATRRGHVPAHHHHAVCVRTGRLRPLDPTRLVAGCGHRRPRRCRMPPSVTWLSNRLPSQGLRKGFGVFVLAVAAVVVIEETLRLVG